MRQSQKRWGNKPVTEILETRRLLAATIITTEPIMVGTPAVHDITFKAANGRSTMILASNVIAAVYFEGTDQPTLYHRHVIFPANNVETIDSVVLTDAAPGKANLTFERLSFGIGTFSIGSISGGDINSINAQDTIITGSLAVTSLHKLSLSGVSGAAVSLGNYPTNVTIAKDFTGSLTAAALGSFTADSLFQARITTTGPYLRAKTQINSIKIGQGIEQSTISATGNIGAMSAGYVDASSISAGVLLPQSVVGSSSSTSTFTVPENAADFTAAAYIRSLKITTAKVGQYQQGFLSDSIISAYNLQSLQLSQLNATGGGIAAHTIGSLTTYSPNGNLDRIKINLNHAQLSSIVKLQSALTQLGVPYESGTVPTDDTVIYGFEINLL